MSLSIHTLRINIFDLTTGLFVTWQIPVTILFHIIVHPKKNPKILYHSTHTNGGKMHVKSWKAYNIPLKLRTPLTISYISVSISSINAKT